ncbi:potassium NKT2 [Micractinium conductrix]|uniref:Potassium NKT2 n=1 Tax=Micractinium conductrix TaxID=554055 RepID=A0A2P6VPW5_9CHLO|nr:potassium NKT2 [Micractinium conductrix]|eukprot:PSC76146.1 potassium NKT2 [Micractinium conductrix]
MPRGVVHPNSKWYQVWWHTTVLVSAITAFLQPYYIAFAPPGLYPYASAGSILVYCMMALIAVDIAVSFRVARYKDGQLVTDKRQLAIDYLKGYFVVDVLSALPLDEIALSIAGLSGPRFTENEELAYYLSLLRLVALLRCYRLFWFFSFLTYSLGTPLIFITLLRSVLFTFYLANCEACLMYYIARQSHFTSTTWVEALGADWFADGSVATQYIYSLYFATITLATVGYGDLHAYSPVEACALVVCVFFNIFYAAYVIGCVTLLVVKGDERVGKYREQMQHLTSYADMSDLPQELRDSMLSHLKLHFNNAHRADETVLGSYPSTIRRRVLRYLYLDILQQSTLFHGARQRFLDALLAAARVEAYLPNEELVSEGDTVNELFVVVSGQLTSYRVSSLFSQEDTVIDMSGKSVRGGRTRFLQEGDVFGAISFFTGAEQMETVLSLGVVRVLAVHRSEYESIADRFKDSARAVLENLARHADEVTGEEFPGAAGAEVLKTVLSSDAATKLQYGGRRAAEAAAALAASAPHAAAGGDDGGLPPLSRSCLTPRQQQAVAALLRVRALVARFVAKHDEDRTTEFLYAASRGDNNRLRAFLEQGFDVNTADYDGRTALMLACVRGFREAALLLLKAGADADAKDAFGGTAMWEACQHGQDECIDLLLRFGGSLGKQGVAAASMLCTCVFKGELSLLRRLLRAGAEADAGDYDGRTALHLAAAEGNLQAAQSLVTTGHANPAALRDRWGNTPLDEARRVGATAVTALLEEASTAAGGPPAAQV